MNAKSIRQLHQQISELWESGQPVELRRTAFRRFEVGLKLQPTSEFLFDQGWSNSAPESGASGPRLRPSTRQFQRKYALVILATLIVSGIVIGGTTIKNIQLTSASAPRSNHHVWQSPKSSASISVVQHCNPPSAPIQPLKTTQTLGTNGKLLLIHDIIIGGERLQEVRLKCLKNGQWVTQDYALRFALISGEWKAKSATPSGSHSRFGTN